MRLYLLHHAEAEPPEVEPRQPLSARGVAEATLLASEAARRGVRPAVIWHSGKLRARQTAESFWRACNPLAEFAAIRGLQPGDPPTWIRDRIDGDARETLCVGHLPNLQRVLRLLLTHDEYSTTVDVSLHGMVALEQADDGGWKEVWRLERPGQPPR